LSRCYLPLGPDWERPLKRFLEALEAVGEQRFFQPHPFTAEAVARLARHTGKDLYCVMVENDKVLAYGMLRGWDEGYEVPSLGIAVHPEARRRGCGRQMMGWLHDAARKRGASRVRLRVLADNLAAVSLYENLGYRFGAREGDYLVGYFPL
jgi:[ribosomal protein S18]-alanine N-acetyltransferase